MSEPIPLSAFPKFIDEESAHFLLLMAEKDLELEICEKALNSLRKEIKNKRPNSAVSSARSLYDNIRKRLRDISQSTIGVEIEKKKPLESSFRETASKEYFITTSSSFIFVLENGIAFSFIFITSSSSELTNWLYLSLII